eukprot:Amastigsp_a174980_79.p2 type:complete len:299 gc:universal Amastigsp_a174980_79:1126-230(-)
MWKRTPNWRVAARSTLSFEQTRLRERHRQVFVWAPAPPSAQGHFVPNSIVSHLNGARKRAGRNKPAKLFRGRLVVKVVGEPHEDSGLWPQSANELESGAVVEMGGVCAFLEQTVDIEQRDLLASEQTRHRGVGHSRHVRDINHAIRGSELEPERHVVLAVHDLERLHRKPRGIERVRGADDLKLQRGHMPHHPFFDFDVAREIREHAAASRIRLRIAADAHGRRIFALHRPNVIKPTESVHVLVRQNERVNGTHSQLWEPANRLLSEGFPTVDQNRLEGAFAVRVPTDQQRWVGAVVP